MWHSNLEKTSISRHVLQHHWFTCPTGLPVRRNLQHRSISTVLSHFRTSVSTSSSSAKLLPPRWLLSGPDKWKSLGVKSGLYCGYLRSSHCSSWNISWVVRAVWGLELSWWNSIHLPVGLEVFCELHRETSTELHSTIQNSHFHHASENGLTVLPQNPKHGKHKLPSWWRNLKLFGWRWTRMFPVHRSTN
jgi:hypothetical protein